MFIFFRLSLLFVFYVLFFPVVVLYKLLGSPRRKKKILIVCFGTPTLAIDSIGPNVGTRLLKQGFSEHRNLKVDVIGTVDDPLTNSSMYKLTGVASGKYDKVVAVDACLFRDGTMNAVIFENNGMHPGAAVNHANNEIGDVSFLVAMGSNINRVVSTIEVNRMTDKTIKEIRYYLNTL